MAEIEDDLREVIFVVVLNVEWQRKSKIVTVLAVK